MDITEVRPVIRNLRARAIDGKRQLVLWDKPTGGVLVGYDIRLCVGGDQGAWREVSNRDVYWGETHHALTITHGNADPFDVIVSVRAKNLHRHSDPMPSTHLAANYKVVVGDRRHEEPRKNLGPSRPHLTMLPQEYTATDELTHADVKQMDNLFDWAREPAPWIFTNRTREEIAFFCRGRKLRNTHQASRLLTDADGTTHDVPITSAPVDARIDQFDFEPDLYILTSVQGSFTSFTMKRLEYPAADVPSWAKEMQEIGANDEYDQEAGRVSHPFDESVPGCWVIATYVVAAFVTDDRTWIAKCREHLLQASRECWDGRVVHGQVYKGISVHCWRDFRHNLLVGLRSEGGDILGLFTLNSPHIR